MQQTCVGSDTFLVGMPAVDKEEWYIGETHMRVCYKVQQVIQVALVV